VSGATNANARADDALAVQTALRVAAIVSALVRAAATPTPPTENGK
jgi:hypothetical protein